jgi:ribosome-binding protein aMBF1 (putative translation factor)
VRGLDRVAASNDNRWRAQATRAHQLELDLFQDQETDDPLTFARWIREQRLRLGISQSALAQRIGCRQPHLANVERGHDRLGEWPSQRLRELIEAAA